MTLVQAQTEYLKLRSRRLSPHTIRKYKTHLRQFATWAWTQHLELTAITREHLEKFLAQRPISQNTENKEAQFYRSLFGFYEDCGWLPHSPARKLEIPRSRPPDKRTYTQEEFIRILAACDRVGQGAYERLRARAAILILRHHALRISDVLGLRCDALQFDTRKGQWRLRIVTQKNKAKLDHPVSQEVLSALQLLPMPVGTRIHEHFFWNGVGRFQNVMDNMQALLRKVYKISGVQGAHNHRFRHTKVTEMLANRAPLPIVARFLGTTDAIVSKHYAKYSPELQDTIDEFASAVCYSPGTTEGLSTNNFHDSKEREPIFLDNEEIETVGSKTI